MAIMDLLHATTHCSRPLCSSIETKIEESLDSKNSQKMKANILWKFENSSKTLEDQNFLEDCQRIKDF